MEAERHQICIPVGEGAAVHQVLRAGRGFVGQKRLA